MQTLTTRMALAQFPALGATIVLGVTEPERLTAVVAHVRSRIEEVNRALSRFRPDSELSRIDAQPDRPWVVSELFGEVLDLALRAAASTNGWFDPTVRDAVEASGYDRSIELIERDGPGLARPVRPAGGWPSVIFDRRSRVLLLPRGVRLDFGGIGKGFAVDYALRDVPRGESGVLVSAGGDLACAGPPPEGGWPCEVAATPDSAPEATVLLQGGALATSGLGRRQWQRDGERLHHLIDPRTGRPGRSPWRIVTVAARTCAAAEVAAKVGWLMGEAGPDWVAAQGLTARFRALDGRVCTIGCWPVEEQGENNE